MTMLKKFLMLLFIFSMNIPTAFAEQIDIIPAGIDVFYKYTNHFIDAAKKDGYSWKNDMPMPIFNNGYYVTKINGPDGSNDVIISINKNTQCVRAIRVMANSSQNDVFNNLLPIICALGLRGDEITNNLWSSKCENEYTDGNLYYNQTSSWCKITNRRVILQLVFDITNKQSRLLYYQFVADSK